MLTITAPMLGSHATGLSTRVEDTKERETLHDAGRHTKDRRRMKVAARRALRRAENAEWRDSLHEELAPGPQAEHDARDEKWTTDLLSEYWWADLDFEPILPCEYCGDGHIGACRSFDYLSDLDDFYYMDGAGR